VPADKRTRLLPVFCLVGVGAGVLLAVVGGLWSTILAGRTIYTPAQAEEWEKAGKDFHSATIGRTAEGGVLPSDPAERDKIVAAARQRYQKAQEELDSARFAQNELGWWLAAFGLAAIASFGIGYIASRRDAEG
jgi:hypothetical protein